MFDQDGAGKVMYPNMYKTNKPNTVKIHCASATNKEEGNAMDVSVIFKATWIPMDEIA